MGDVGMGRVGRGLWGKRGGGGGKREEAEAGEGNLGQED